MARPAGESNDEVLKLDFDRRLILAILRLRSHVRCLIVGIPLTRMCRRALTCQVHRTKGAHDEFLARRRGPIRVVLDSVVQNYNIGAIFRLCDALLWSRPTFEPLAPVGKLPRAGMHLASDRGAFPRVNGLRLNIA